MKALCWHGKHDVRYDTVPDPQIQDAKDCIIKVTACAICGSDVHLFDGMIPTMESGDVLGHETMGEVVEVGSDCKNLKVGDRVVVPFTIACGECFFCKKGFFSGCERSNPNKATAEKVWGHSPAGLFGYSHMLGGFAGGQAEYMRVPYADVGPAKVPDNLSDEQVLFLSDIFPTGYMAADFCNIQPEDTIAVFGCGPVGQFCHSQRISPGRPSCDRHRHGARAACSCESGGGRNTGLRQRRYPRTHSGNDFGPRCRCLYRRRGHGSRRDCKFRFHARSRQGRDLPRHRSSSRAAPSDQ